MQLTEPCDKLHPTITVVAVIGTGVIGRSWMQVFTRAGCETRVYDKDRTQLEKAVAWIRQDLVKERDIGLITPEEEEERIALISARTDLMDALNGAGYVQESGPEQIESKIAIYKEL